MDVNGSPDRPLGACSQQQAGTGMVMEGGGIVKGNQNERLGGAHLSALVGWWPS
jgi:hypothetical protein